MEEKKKRNTRQYHLNKTTIKATKFGMTLFNGTYLWSFLSNQKNYTILRFRSHYSIITTTIITTGYLQKFQDGLQILAVRGFRKPVEEISQEELNACLRVSTHLRGLQLQKFINEIRTSISHNVCFRLSASLNKTFAQVCTAITLLDKLEV